MMQCSLLLARENDLQRLAAGTHVLRGSGIQQQSRFVALSLRPGIRWRKWCFTFL
jgi:hypothetical protein